ncbi:hypothetical protein D9M68_644690 [compost metagenome]
MAFGVSPARLGTRLTVPPTAPLGAMPLNKAFGPLSTSTRSTNSSGVRPIGARPNMPLMATSFWLTSKPRMRKFSYACPLDVVNRTDGSFAITSASVRACWFWMSSDV